MALDLNDRLQALGLPSVAADLDNAAPVGKLARNRLNTSSASDLETRVFEPIRWVVPGFIAEGVTLLAGKPKLGKSWLCLDIALAVATGGTVLGGVQCEQGDVLYLALEDNERRLQRRLKTLKPDGSWPANLAYATECPTLDEGGAELIRNWIGDAGRPRLVIIDVLARVRGKRNYKDQLYEQDYAAIRPLLDAVNGTGIALVLVHHARKTSGDDRLDAVSGSTGLTGSMETVLVLDRGSDMVTLYGRGRDVEEIETALNFDKQACRWTALGDPNALRRSDQRRDVIELLEGEPNGMRPKQVAETLGMTDANTRQLLSRMASDCDIRKIKRGVYGPILSQPSQCHDPDEIIDDC